MSDSLTHDVKIEMTGPGQGKVWLDDFEVKGVFKLSFDVEVNAENWIMLWINCHTLKVNTKDVRVGVQVDALLKATEDALAAAESLIKSDYECTSGYEEMMKRLEPVRQAIARAKES